MLPSDGELKESSDNGPGRIPWIPGIIELMGLANGIAKLYVN